jgi:hypothetical protein
MALGLDEAEKGPYFPHYVHFALSPMIIFGLSQVNLPGTVLDTVAVTNQVITEASHVQENTLPYRRLGSR